MTTLGFAANVPPVTVDLGWSRGRKPGAGTALFAVGVLAACTPEARPLPDVPAGPSAASAAAPGRDLGWSYQGALGPDKWATLRPEWAACAGPGQSPIDLPLDAIGTTTVEPGLAISLDLPPATLQVRSNGQVVSLVGTGGLTLSMDGHRAPIEQIDLHVPAEHSLGGATFDAEVVFVAKSAGERPILLSLLYRVGTPNPAFAPLLEQLPDLRAPGDHSLEKQVDLSGFAPAAAPVLTYEGSLGVPPCTTGVLRLVVAQVGELSTEQLSKLRQTIPRSARPAVDRAQRPVTLRSLAPATAPAAAPSPANPPSPSPAPPAAAPSTTSPKKP